MQSRHAQELIGTDGRSALKSARGQDLPPELPPLNALDVFTALDANYSEKAVRDLRARALSGDIEGASADYHVWRRAHSGHPLRNTGAELFDDALMARSKAIAEALRDDGVLHPFHLDWTTARVDSSDPDWVTMRAESPSAWADAARGYYWNDLGRAWRSTNDARLPEIWRSMSTTWLDAHRPRASIWPPGTPRPYPTDWAKYPYNDPAWQPLVVGIRLQDTLPSSLEYFRNAPEMTPELHLQLMGAVLEQTRFLMDYDTRMFNWQAIEAGGLAISARCFPEFSESAEWRAEAIRRARDVVATQLMPDGAQHELSPHYQIVVARNLWLVIGAAEEAHVKVADLKDALVLMTNWSQALRRPDGTEPLLGDSTGTIPLAAPFYADEWRDSGGGASVPHPPQQSLDTFHASSGFYVARTGWSPKDLYVGFDLGPLGFSHWHEDGLHVSYERGGHAWLVDSGRGYYDDGPSRVHYFQHSSGHNTALPGSRSQCRSVALPMSEWAKPERVLSPNVAVQRARWSYADGTYSDSYGPLHREQFVAIDGLAPRLEGASHRRTIFVDRTTQRLWVFDRLQSDQPVAWETWWHLDATTIQRAGSRKTAAYEAFRLAHRDDLRETSLWLGILRPIDADHRLSTWVSGQRKPRPQGWIHDAWAPPRPDIALRVVQPASIDTWQAAVFSPESVSISPWLTGFEEWPIQSWRSSLPSGEFRILHNPERNRLISKGLTTDAALLAIWLDASGAVDHWAAIAMTVLILDGREVHRSDLPQTVEKTDGSLWVSR